MPLCAYAATPTLVFAATDGPGSPSISYPTTPRRARTIGVTPSAMACPEHAPIPATFKICLAPDGRSGRSRSSVLVQVTDVG